jgi:hypothetical protein
MGSWRRQEQPAHPGPRLGDMAWRTPCCGIGLTLHGYDEVCRTPGAAPGGECERRAARCSDSRFAGDERRPQPFPIAFTQGLPKIDFTRHVARYGIVTCYRSGTATGFHGLPCICATAFSPCGPKEKKKTRAATTRVEARRGHGLPLALASLGCKRAFGATIQWMQAQPCIVCGRHVQPAGHRIRRRKHARPA